MLPRKIFDRDDVIWCNLGRPKVCYYQPKHQQFEGEKSTRNFNWHSLSPINIDEHVSRKIKTIRIYKGGPRSRRNLKKNHTKLRLFLIFFFAFCQGSLNPQNYELAP